MKFLLAMVVWLATSGPQTPSPRLQKGTVTGVLRTESGTPMQGVRVAVEPLSSVADASVLESIGLTDGAGRYVLENVTAGRYHVVMGRVNALLYHPGVAEANRATTIVVVDGQITEVPDMVFSRTRVAGRIVDLKSGQGRSIKSLVLCCDSTALTSSSTGMVTTQSLQLISATVNEDGTFVFNEVPPGKYSLHASDPGTVPVAQSIEVGEKDVEDVEFKVTGGVRVDGFVTDRLNTRVTSINITLKPDPGNTMLETEAPPSASMVVMRISFTGVGPASTLNTFNIVKRAKDRAMMATAEGEFSFAGVLPGRYTLEANAPGGYAFSRQIEVGIHDALKTALDLPFAQVMGRIVGSDDSALPRITGSVRFVSADPDSRITFGFPDDTGRFRVLLPKGEYRLFTDTLNVDSSIESISDGVNDLRANRFIVAGERQQQIRITVAH